jgi:hypothetical protein
MSRIAFPYPTLFPHVPAEGVWEARIDDRVRLFRDGSGSWDYDSVLSIQCRLPWTVPLLFREAGLEELLPGARLAVVLATGSSEGTGRRFIATDIALSDLVTAAEKESEQTSTIRFSVDSPGLCQRLRATLFIHTAGGVVGGMRVLPGSVLYREEATLQLEGELASFPIRSLDFAVSGLGDGLWLVDCSADSPGDPLLSCVTLLLNSQRQSFIDQLQNEPAETGILRWAVRSDVMASVLSSLLQNEHLDFEPASPWPDGSLGAVAAGWLRSMGIEGNTAVRRISDEIRREPGRFRQRCQAACTPMEVTP